MEVYGLKDPPHEGPVSRAEQKHYWLSVDFQPTPRMITMHLRSISHFAVGFPWIPVGDYSNILALSDDWRHFMTLSIGSTAPDFEADTTQGKIKFHDWIGNSWAILFSHPKDFTPVCTTELGYMAKLKPDFDKRNVKVIGLSVDPVDSHTKWEGDIKETQGYAVNFPMIGDPDLKISKAYGMLPAETPGSSTGRTAADNLTVRNVFVIGPDKKIKLIIAYPMTTGRNFDEVLRVIDSLQLTAKHRVATPVNWKHGEDVIIAGSVSDEEAKKIYPQGWKAPKAYLRIVPQPK
jgi:thioredoxin-dependent peroxiredoxin